MADNAPIDIIRSHQDDLDRESARQEQKLRPHSAAPEDEKYERDVPPDGGYGWVCVACVFWINAHTWGINSVSILDFGSLILHSLNCFTVFGVHGERY